MHPGQETPTCCAVILAGGLNTRMEGRNKAFIDIGGQTILDRLLHTLRPLFQQILLVTRQPEDYIDLPVRIVKDVYTARSSLTGIHAGLKHADTDYALMVPCDAPFLQPELIRLLLGEIDPEVDAVVPRIKGYYEPLCAIYSRRCLAPIESQLDRGRFKITLFFDRIRLKTLSEEKIKRADPDLRSFLNVNTPEALKLILAIDPIRGNQS